MDPISSSPLEDGSTAFFDSSGQLQQIVSRDGSVYQADTSIASDFLRSVQGAFGDAIRSAFARPAATPSAPAQAAQTKAQNTQQLLVTVLAIAGGLFLAKKLLV